MDWLAVVGVALVLVLLYVWWLARRVARLQARTRAALSALEAQLGRRATAAISLTGEAAEPAREAAAATLVGGPADTDGRQALENDLVRQLRVLGRLAAELPDLRSANRRLAVARQVYNDSVRDTRALRTARVPRAFRLGSGAPLPGYFDVDELDLDALALAGGQGVGEATTGQS